MSANPPVQVPFRERLQPLPQVAVPGRILLFAALTTVIGLVNGAAVRNYPQSAPLHHDLTRPILALEIPGQASDLQVTISPPGSAPEVVKAIRSMFVNSLYLDFALIPSYSGLFAFSLAWLGYRWFTPVAIAAGTLDIAENVLLLRLLAKPLPAIDDSAASAIRRVSLGKWGCIAVVLLLIGWALTNVELRPFRRPGTGLLSIITMLSGGIGLTGVVPELPWPAEFFTHRHIELMTILSAVYPLVLIGAGVYELRVSRRNPGLMESRQRS